MVALNLRLQPSLCCNKKIGCFSLKLLNNILSNDCFLWIIQWWNNFQYVMSLCLCLTCSGAAKTPFFFFLLMTASVWYVTKSPPGTVLCFPLITELQIYLHLSKWFDVVFCPIASAKASLTHNQSAPPRLCCMWVHMGSDAPWTTLLTANETLRHRAVRAFWEARLHFFHMVLCH